VARPAALRHQLFLLLVLPALIVVGAVAYLADTAAHESLEAALADRLSAIALSGGEIAGHRVTFLEAGDEDSRIAQNATARLGVLRDRTGVARILIVSLDNEVLIDSSGELGIGEPYLRARFDEPELERVRRGKPSASVLFEGKDGRPHKTGYAPVEDDDHKVVAYAAVVAAADYTAAMGALRTTVSLIALLGLGFLVALATVSARRVSVPLSELSAAARRIGEGKLDTEIPAGGPEEAIALEATMRAMTASLRARDEEMQMMLAGIAHEVRNPLGGIEIFANFLKEDLDPTDPKRKHVDKILRELGVLSRVVNDFLDFARRRPLEPQMTRVRDLLADMVALLDKDAAEKGVAIDVEAPADLTFRLDPEAMKRAILNLVKNAIQAAPKDAGKVLVSGRLEGEALAIGVEDNGPGIPEEKRSEVFTPFFTTKQKGTGLGLALVKKTVVAHDGTVAVEASRLGGAAFLITLPKEPRKRL
jgi:signal transduction histidine kinase